jgi:hypothetical protein
MKNWFKYRFDWMSVYFSPFKPIIPKLYIGKVAIGTPYFLPRKFRRYTAQEAIDAAVRELNEKPQYRKIGFEKLYYDYSRRSKSVPKKIGFDFVGLGWKTKWSGTDYRHEWNPVWSFVFFKWQIALTFAPENDTHYWECWIYYSRDTKDVANTTEGRLAVARKGFPCVWNSTRDGIETKTCYWDIILKDKWKCIK